MPAPKTILSTALGLFLLSLLSCSSHTIGLDHDGDVERDTGPEDDADLARLDADIDRLRTDSDTDVPDEDSDIDVPDECAEATADIAAIVSDEIGCCSALLRFDYITLEPTGWSIICGEYAPTTIVDAAEAARDIVGFDTSSYDDLESEGVFFIFYPPGDFGAMAVISARTGLALFGGTVVWMGAGEIEYPESFRVTTELGLGCDSERRELTVRTLGIEALTGDAVDEDAIDALVDLLWSTSLPDALQTGMSLFDIDILVYPRTVGEFAPHNAEYLVFLHAGWLE